MRQKLLFATAFTALSLMPAFAQEGKMMQRLISLSGHGEVYEIPNMAVISLGVLAQADTAREALDSNTKSMTSLMEALKKSNIDDRDIQTSDFRVSPRYEFKQDEQPLLRGYDVSNTVSVQMKDMAMIGNILDVAVSSGANQISNIAFNVEKAEIAESKARKMAIADAMERAKLYAEAAGVKLGNIVSIQETNEYTPRPQSMRMSDMAAKAAPVPIARGEQKISANVTIVWEIK